MSEHFGGMDFSKRIYHYHLDEQVEGFAATVNESKLAIDYEFAVRNFVRWVNEIRGQDERDCAVAYFCRLTGAEIKRLNQDG